MWQYFPGIINVLDDRASGNLWNHFKRQSSIIPFSGKPFDNSFLGKTRPLCTKFVQRKCSVDEQIDSQAAVYIFIYLCFYLKEEHIRIILWVKANANIC